MSHPGCFLSWSGLPWPAASAEQQRRTAFFAPAYERLVQLVRGRVRYPEDYDNLGPEDKKVCVGVGG